VLAYGIERAALPWYHSAQRAQHWEEAGIYDLEFGALEFGVWSLEFGRF
jgi:hypothetical protein